jgi:hypothetical protein
MSAVKECLCNVLSCTFPGRGAVACTRSAVSSRLSSVGALTWWYHLRATRSKAQL